MTSATSASTFPPDFMWGVATSSYQIEGCVDQGGRGVSIWDTFSHTPGKTRDGETGDLGVDHYRRYKEDVAIMADLGVKAYRFSIAWSRIIPDGAGTANEEGLQFYRNLCQELIANGITPVATLYHWDLPQALEDKGGWLNPASPGWFAAYAGTAKEGLGDLVKSWWTLNEPWCSAFLGYGDGAHAPGTQDPAEAFVAAHHLMLAHHAALETMRATNPHEEDTYGIVLNPGPAVPNSDSPEDVAAAAAIDAVQNHLFGDAAVLGTYPDLVREFHDHYGVSDRIDYGELASKAQPLDLLGVNYYDISRVEHRPGSSGGGARPGSWDVAFLPPPGEVTTMGWGVRPHGLTLLLSQLAERYPGIPMMVTENGAAFDDEVGDGSFVDDQNRLRYISSHINAVHDAIEQGVDVRGYFAWSLLDNFEWAHGYHQLFGIVRVDFETMERTMKASALWYKDFLSR